MSGGPYASLRHLFFRSYASKNIKVFNFFFKYIRESVFTRSASNVLWTFRAQWAKQRSAEASREWSGSSRVLTELSRSDGKEEHFGDATGLQDTRVRWTKAPCESGDRLYIWSLPYVEVYAHGKNCRFYVKNCRFFLQCFSN